MEKQLDKVFGEEIDTIFNPIKIGDATYKFDDVAWWKIIIGLLAIDIIAIIALVI